MNTGDISNLFRLLGLTNIVDQMRFHYQKWNNRHRNAHFIKMNKNLVLPNDWLMYESFKLDYSKYYLNGRDTAHWLVSHFSRYIEPKGLKILDWGCGPGRIIRHLPSILDESSEFFGTDLNTKAISWCLSNLPGIRFYKNTLEAHLPFPNDFFDVVYGISIFTHLSEQSHFTWFGELCRIIKSTGILMITTQGENFKAKLASGEIEAFNNGQLVVRGKVKEGHRTYSAFHPKEFMFNLFKDAHILMHDVRKPTKDNLLPQDLWIVRKV